MKLKSFLSRYASISITKVSLLLNRAILLILSFQWLNTSQYALLAMTISLVEVLRVIGDFGIETILYAKIKGIQQTISPTFKHLIGIRLFANVALTSLIIVIWMLNDGPNYLIPILLVPLLSNILNTSFYVLQKHKRYKDILIINLSTLILCFFSILLSHITKANGLALSFYIISGEIISAILVIYYTKKEFASILKYTVQSNSLRLLSRLKNFMIPSFFVAILVILYSRLDITLVLPLLGQAKQAEFSYAFRFLDPLFLMLSIGSFALLVELGGTNRKNTVDYYRKLERIAYINNVPFLLLSSTVLGTAVTYIIKQVLHINIQTSLIFILACLIFIRLANSTQSIFLQRFGRFDLVCTAAMITFFSTYIIGYFLSINYDLIGVGISILLAELLNMLYQNHQLKRVLKYERSTT